MWDWEKEKVNWKTFYCQGEISWLIAKKLKPRSKGCISWSTVDQLLDYVIDWQNDPLYGLIWLMYAKLAKKRKKKEFCECFRPQPLIRLPSNFWPEIHSDGRLESVTQFPDTDLKIMFPLPSHTNAHRKGWVLEHWIWSFELWISDPGDIFRAADIILAWLTQFTSWRRDSNIPLLFRRQ